MKKYAPLLLASLALAGCGSKNDSTKAFEEYFGDYLVESYSEQLNSTPGTNPCPLTDASIRAGQYEGHDAVILEASGNTNGCQSTMRSVLSIEGFDGITCKSSPGYTRCEKDGSVFEARATRDGDRVRIETRGTGRETADSLWQLRRK